MTDVSVLDVLLYGEPVGTLTNVGGDRTIFAFNDGYIDDPDRLTLGLAFKDEFGGLLSDFRVYQKRLMPFFSNLLPEGHLRTYLAEKAGVNAEREFHLLSALGHDLPGAVTIRFANDEAWSASGGGANGAADAGSVPSMGALRFSLAGVQLKLSAALAPSGGLTIPASGVGGSWIVKLPSREFDAVPENEYSMMTLARLVGIDVPLIDLVDTDAIDNLPEGIDKVGQRAFVIERFDRLSDGSAVHIEDFAQVYGVYAEQKYQKATMRNIAQVLAAETCEADIVEFVRRLVFCALIGNGDMHLKNWSLIYPDRRRAALAPAYDLVSTIPYIPSDDLGLRVSRTRAFSELTFDELKHMAAKAALPGKLVRDTALETVALFQQHWQTEKLDLPMTSQVREAIETHLKTLPIAQ
ncbi:type II toxin-antitoxin system HipA family toxin [Halomonas sp. DP5N14-9]|uniref:type II toxin-antitoxin system HipA family toxin n=1 Tax=Halomonas sp. DP5N14-9 TaxID=2859075 RepID=UPI001C997198|nr:HipA domain-containing protein [Halomonas sp. DP5N14-9]MBY5940879.1 type II toxin-antitoxin system HipA family toxin [Halomonas sp. DP5N14-9]